MRTSPDEVAAVILAAGYSSRMGFFKPLAPLNGAPVLDRVIRSIHEAGINDVLVVSGFDGERIAPLIERLGAKRVHNPRFAEGMFTSVQAGVAALPHKAEAFLLLPVDIPTVRVSTLRMMLSCASSDTVLCPMFQTIRGHPPLIGASLVPHLLNFHGEGGLRAFLETWKSVAEDILVADEGVLLDMDTPEDYARLCKRASILRIPSRSEREALFDIAGTPARVRHHCEATAFVCLALGIALKKRSVRVDLTLLTGAALLHDICKHLPDHVETGDMFLRVHGFPLIAEVMACHKDLPPNSRVEGEILHLADKLVAHTETVSLDERKREMKILHGESPKAWSAIRKRYAAARKTARRIERICGQPLDNLLKNTRYL